MEMIALLGEGLKCWATNAAGGGNNPAAMVAGGPGGKKVHKMVAIKRRFL
ncbi:MAG: hypothetical protein ACYS21_21330 [Planctomycetota bacterium]|jgi:hypothetical protein